MPLNEKLFERADRIAETIFFVRKNINSISDKQLRQANKIIEELNVMIFAALQSLSDGDPRRAKKFIYAALMPDPSILNRFFYLNYIVGMANYLDGDYQKAAAYLERYIEARAQNDYDPDEIAELYLKNAVDNEPKFIRHNYDLDCWKAPIFINARDRVDVMKNLIDWLLDAGYKNLIVLDNASTYPPLFEFYQKLRADGRVRVIELKKNLGFKALWLSGVLDELNIQTPYVYTDPDVIPIERCPKNVVERLLQILRRNTFIKKVGLGLVCDDLTIADGQKYAAIEQSYYDGSNVGDELFYAQVDTTFALYQNLRHYSLRFSLRTTGDLMLRHLPWYFDYDNLPPDEKYYLEQADRSSTIARTLRAEHGVDSRPRNG